MSIAGDELEQIHLITLDNPLLGLQRAEVKHLFAELMSLRARGYGPPFYPPCLLPCEANDFIAWHHVFCLIRDGESEPIASYKTVSYSRCRYYYTTPPYFGIAQESSSSSGFESLQQVVNNSHQQRKDVLLASGFTIDPAYRGRESKLGYLIKQGVAALMAYDSKQYGDSPMVGGGVPKYKTEKLWSEIGFDYLKDKNGLPVRVEYPAIEGGEILFMCASSFSDWSLRCLDRFQKLIDQRTLLGVLDSEDLTNHQGDDLDSAA